METSLKGPVSLVAFKKLVGDDLLIEPRRLKPVRELAESETWIVEEARLQHPGEVAPAPEKKEVGTKAVNAPGLQVIVKSFRPTWIQSQGDLKELIEETRRLKGLICDRIVQTVGMGCYYIDSPLDIRSSIFIVEEFAGTWTVFKMIRNRKLHPSHPHVQFNQYDILRWCIDIAEGLLFLHEKGIVHRDLKSENIFLDDVDVHESRAHIGDVKPHRRAFRKPMSETTATSPRALQFERQATLARHAEIDAVRTASKVAMQGLAAPAPQISKYDPTRAVAAAPVLRRPSVPGSGRGASPRSTLGRRLSSDNLDSFKGDGSNHGAPVSASVIALLEAEREKALAKRKKNGKKVTFSTNMPSGWADSFHYSLIYMAPEYVASQDLRVLTYKSDVFSFSKVMYELLSYTLINPASTDEDEGGWHLTAKGLERYARRVADGYREPIPDKWPSQLTALVQQMWQKDPSMRPSMPFVLKRLKELSVDPEVLKALEPPPALLAEAVPEGSYLSRSWDDDEEENEDARASGHGHTNAGLGRTSASGIARLSAGLGRISGGTGASKQPSQKSLGRVSANSERPSVSRTTLNRKSPHRPKQVQGNANSCFNCSIS